MVYCPKCSEQRDQGALPPPDLAIDRRAVGQCLPPELATGQPPCSPLMGQPRTGPQVGP
jgi:hypothetical protein